MQRTVSDGDVVELGKTSTSRRQVPLTRRALAALEELPPRLDTPLLFPAPGGGRSTSTTSAGASGRPRSRRRASRRPARIYDLRSTFASNALAAGVTVFELARVMGTSVAMIERHYGALLDGAHAGIAARLDALEAELEAHPRRRREEVNQVAVEHLTIVTCDRCKTPGTMLTTASRPDCATRTSAIDVGPPTVSRTRQSDRSRYACPGRLASAPSMSHRRRVASRPRSPRPAASAACSRDVARGRSVTGDSP